MTEIIGLTDASIGYGREAVLRNVSMTISAGDFTGIIGSNGSGKTTLLKTMLGLLRPVSGKVRKKPGLRSAYVMQRHLLNNIFPLTLRDIVVMGRYGLAGPLKRLRKEDHMKVDECMELAGIAAIGRKRCSEISGGQMQRVLIARALASEPDVLLLDEPTNDLDIRGEDEIMQLLQKIHGGLGVTVIMVSHLLHVVLNYVDRVALINGGELTEFPIGELIEKDVLSRVYDVPVTVSAVRNRYAVTVGRNDDA